MGIHGFITQTRHKSAQIILRKIQIKSLIANGVAIEQIIYVNFEDERLLEIKAEDLNMILEIGHEFAGADRKPYIFSWMRFRI